MQIKVTRYHNTSSETPKSQSLTIPNAEKDMEEQELSFIAANNAK